MIPANVKMVDIKDRDDFFRSLGLEPPEERPVDDKCKECGGPWDLHKMDCGSKNAQPKDEEEDFLTGKTCNPDAPEECESCQ